ncbi:uncharacterized protein YecE (DUF72 family) [Hydrogenispora ethanolica]|jgi:uncharacterized protein YecE (DUF72 family)|uniref:Uncharacterized protein YecE (DUF72 family) n=1 Tax=Hydrogenispora ethanolica TaxID=1082276 RepID=A0A4R1RIM5_HYDET|nr:DUF72 domain-containing protein [Hydrogenispora ethanolica]TCL65958.1 uncharacterized protein YecE (DUF72 family) [Hydrogenispora ethanolica]
MADIYIGISGFSYSEWRGIFYPPGLPDAEMLPYYAARFPTVELNNTAYRLPAVTTLQRWAAAVGPEFRFGVKARRTLTVAEEPDPALLRLFLSRIVELGAKLGPVLFQFPPARGAAEVDRLVAALAAATDFSQSLLNHCFVEMRNPALLQPGFFDFLAGQGLGICLNDQFLRPGDWPEPSGGAAYLRLRSAPYSAAQLEPILAKLEGWRSRGWDCYVYCRHERSAPALAELLQRLVAAQKTSKIY